MRHFFAVMRFILTGIVALLLVLLLAGCTVGPKYIKPTVPTTSTYKEEVPGSFKESDQWQPARPGDRISRGNWWEVFGDPELNKLEEQIASSNQNLKVAEARFREARAAIRFNRGSQFPTISAVPSASYVKSSEFSPNFPSKIQQSPGKKRKRPLPTTRPPSSACRRSSPWTISNCAAPTLRNNFSTIP